MNKIEKTLAKKYLKRVSSSEVTYLDETIKSNSLLDYKLFPEYDGIYTYSIDNNTYEFLFTFKKECIDYNIAMFLDKKLDEAIKNKQDKRLYVVCDLNQTTLYQLLCKKDFDKAHRGVEYRILTKNIKKIDNNSLIIKDYDNNDEEKYLNILMDAFLYQDLKSNDVSNYESTKKYWEKEIFNNNKYQFYSFYLNNELVGFTVYSGHLLVYLVIDPKYQGKGYGEYILNKSLREYCNKYNYKYINLYTYLINIKARNLYEKVGFKVVGKFCMSYYKG